MTFVVDAPLNPNNQTMNLVSPLMAAPALEASHLVAAAGQFWPRRLGPEREARVAGVGVAPAAVAAVAAAPLGRGWRRGWR